MSDFLILSFVPLLVAVFAAMACALPGTLLVLRGQALVGDMVSHAVLPGLVAGFLLTGGASGLAMSLGAGASAVLAVGLSEAIRRLARIEPGAAMGITFTTFFAGGVLLLEMTGARGVHLDVEHALYGNLESLIWLDATGPASLIDPTALAGLPPELPRMAITFAGVGLGLWVLWRPLVLASFDGGFAGGIGLPVGLLSLALVVATAMAAVAAFAAVGSILTVAMLICPPATARLLTNRLATQVALALAIAAGAAATGFWLALALPQAAGLPGAVSAAGMIAVVAGLCLGAAALWGPQRRRAGV